MFLSIFDMFKIGIGPSSSHTMGPMVAAARFLEVLQNATSVPRRLECRLHGSLAFTGRGHGTDRAILLGLAGYLPETFDADLAARDEATIRDSGTIAPPGFDQMQFAPDTDLIFDYGPALPLHPNGLVFSAYDASDVLCASETYYSVGGGFVQTGDELDLNAPLGDVVAVPYPFKSVAEMLEMAQASGLSIAAMKLANEKLRHPQEDIPARIKIIWQVMDACINRGLAEGGILPGGLKLRRRAKAIHEALVREHGKNLSAPHTINDWIAVYAIAVNEENAAGGKVVTAPTNGAAGVIPATLRYYLDHVPGATPAKIEDFLLTAAAIGGLIKTNASISGAEVGCQGEVGSAASMAAGALCAILGGTPAQIENAAEIALEHHLGMTCDPVAGLVQAPCIERNGLGAIKAVSAASLALRGDGQHLISLDACIATMLQTGRDMSTKYKETSLGGLAVNVPNC